MELKLILKLDSRSDSPIISSDELRRIILASGALNVFVKACELAFDEVCLGEWGGGNVSYSDLKYEYRERLWTRIRDVCQEVGELQWPDIPIPPRGSNTR